MATIYPHRVLRVTERDGWVELYITVDSGAIETVIGPKQVPWDYQPSYGSVNGIMYEVANGTKIPNLGQQRMTLKTSEGKTRVITAQVCDVHKCLLSVSKLNYANQIVVLDGDESYIQDKTSGDKIKVDHKDRVYFLKAWVRATEDGVTLALCEEQKAAAASGFPGPAR